MHATHSSQATSVVQHIIPSTLDHPPPSNTYLQALIIFSLMHAMTPSSIHQSARHPLPSHHPSSDDPCSLTYAKYHHPRPSLRISNHPSNAQYG